jgi:hypothetical protein
VKVVMLFSVSPDEPDPERGHPEGGLHYELVADGVDCMVVWREWGDQFEGGFLDHFVTQGIWENVTREQIDEIVTALGKDS